MAPRTDIGGGADHQLHSMRQRLSWFLFARVLVITLFLGGTIFYQLRGTEAGANPVLPFLFFLTGITYVQTLLSAAVLPLIRRLKVFAHLQIIWDLLFVTLLIYVTGGIESLFSFLYILVIVASSIFFTRQEILFVASAAAILYGSLLDLQFYGYLPRFGGLQFPESLDGGRFFYAVFVNVLAFLLTALLSGGASERLRRSESALERREIDYVELDSLNRTILENITSGLMIINRAGKIRSFNAAASRITGYTLEEVYDWDACIIFPELDLFHEQDFAVHSRKEAHVVSRRGQTLTLGYASSLIEEAQGSSSGLLVTFQDLTELKKMEEQLKRADRLAAVGRLAAGMAHEIRNPLASISGSIQLMMEGSNLSEEEKRLMGIVVREAERLSGLLTDFLVYARPAPPNPIAVNVAALLNELADMLAADSRFSAVEILRDYPSEFRVEIDRQQMHQALWNLVINGAEAMQGRGRLRLAVDPGERTITVEDTGPGIAVEARDKIFDPFFTTKDGGTGLGLATVYAIVEAHGGRIEAGERRRGGARFTIFLPRAPRPEQKLH